MMRWKVTYHITDEEQKEVEFNRVTTMLDNIHGQLLVGHVPKVTIEQIDFADNSKEP